MCDVDATLQRCSKSDLKEPSSLCVCFEVETLTCVTCLFENNVNVLINSTEKKKCI